MLPKFTRTKNGDLLLYRREHAEKGVASSGTPSVCKQQHQVKANAIRAVQERRGDVKNEKHVLGQYTIEFGKYRGQTFLWMVENCLGYAGWLVDNMRSETITQAPLSQNKNAFKDYLLSFPEGNEVVDMKKAQRLREEEKKKVPPFPARVLFSHLPSNEARKLLRQHSNKQHAKIKPNLLSSPRKRPVDDFPYDPIFTDDALVEEVAKLEAEILPGPSSSQSSGVKSQDPRPTHGNGQDKYSTPLIAVPVRRIVAPKVAPVSKAVSSSDALASGSSSSVVPAKRVAPPSVVPDKKVIPQKVVPAKKITPPSVEPTKTVTPAIPSMSVRQDPAIVSEVSMESVETTESGLVPGDEPEPSSTSQSVYPIQSTRQEYPIIDSWKSSLPAIDIPWISKALFSYNTRGKPELDDRKIDRLWYEPPQPPLIPNQRPKQDRYFGHRLLLWMPLRMFKVKLTCPMCKTTELTKQGPYRNTRMVFDLDGFYILAGEYLHCHLCKKNQISWNQCILDQLDPGTRCKFPVQILYKTACDNRVMYMMHQRGLGNSPMQLQKQICELHNSVWTSKVTQYLQDCKVFSAAAKSGLISAIIVEDTPKQLPVPTYQWFIDVYCQEVTGRLSAVKAAITSIFGRVLKMDSTKKVTKKLAGRAARTASWCTNVSNEFGQVLMSVMTAGEGSGLESMASGIVQRYAKAEVPPPVLMYVDSHCCGPSQLMDIFRDAWPDLALRLDVWHFMRRIAVGVTTDTHRLYGTLMSQLSHAIFKWDKDDLTLLKAAKRAEMIAINMKEPTEQDVINRLSRKEMALHCRRTTRGAEETISMIQMLLEMFDGEQGRDTMGVPLFHHERIWEIWRVQKKHVVCLQDPDKTPLYTQTGTLKKGGVSLPIFRCARGSTSLESFHLHLQHFIPGTSASANNFQAYLLEGIHRWNEDRMVAAIDAHPDPVCYSFTLRHDSNQLGEEMLGKKFYPNYKDPRQYTGELIGIDYLFSQTGRPLGDAIDEREYEKEKEEEGTEQSVDEGFEDVEEVEDLTVNVVDSFLPTGVMPSTGNTTSQDSSPEKEVTSPPSAEAVGPDNVGGYQHVVVLADFLFHLKDKEPPVVSNAEANRIVQLWDNLTPYDQTPSKFRDNFKQQLIKGRFKAPKSTRVDLVPGVQSVKRCALAPHQGPAAWPDTNRYQEAFVSRLCSAFPASSSKDGRRQPRLKSVMEAYNKVRDMIFCNGKVMAETNLQLPDISHRTLTAWFSARSKRREKETLEQGLSLIEAPQTATLPLPAALPKPADLDTGTAAPHQFVIQQSTVGKSTKGRRRLFPKPPTVTVVQPVPIMPHVPLTVPKKTVPDIPYSTKHYRKMKEKAEQEGDFRRQYIRKSQVTACGQCGEDKSGGGHHQYYGNIYCPSKSTQSYEEWKSDLKARGYGKRKAKRTDDSVSREKVPREEEKS